LWEEYKRVLDELEFQDDREEHFKEREAFETTYYNVKAIMTKLIEEGMYLVQNHQIQFLIIQSIAIQFDFPQSNYLHLEVITIIGCILKTQLIVL
jgi:hypothetical protein